MSKVKNSEFSVFESFGLSISNLYFFGYLTIKTVSKLTATAIYWAQPKIMLGDWGFIVYLILTMHWDALLSSPHTVSLILFFRLFISVCVLPNKRISLFLYTGSRTSTRSALNQASNPTINCQNHFRHEQWTISPQGKYVESYFP